VARAAKGDGEAADALVRRYSGILKRWAHNRLPASARGRASTQDLVQVTLLRTLQGLGSFEMRGEGAFTAYLHRALVNQIRDEIRAAARRPRQGEITHEPVAAGPSPHDAAVQGEFMSRYQAALSRLNPEQQQAVVLRIELGHTYPEIAEAIGSPSPAAARMLVDRGLVKLARDLKADEGGGEKAPRRS
jgi:RNA polymerase sigma-70 factor (ECF subfamily)